MKRLNKRSIMKESGFKTVGKIILGLFLVWGIFSLFKRSSLKNGIFSGAFTEGFESNQGQGEGQGIPKIIIQTSKNKPDQKVINNFIHYVSSYI